MAYTNAIYRMDLINGSDTALPSFTAAYANNGSGVVRGTYNNHGLVTGAIVYIASGSYSGAWKVTVIDANNFDLDGSTYSSSTNQTTYPRRGYSWATAFRTIAGLSTAWNPNSGYQKGDKILMPNTCSVISIGNASFTYKSDTITLSTAKNLTLDLCETAWTAANGATTGTSITRKQGSYSASITLPASVATNTKYAYKTITSLDASAYDSCSFWLSDTETAAVVAGKLKLCLCSDTTGDVVVDIIDVPAYASGSVGTWCPITAKKRGGGSLGSAIQSIALYTGDSATPSASKTFYLDDIITANWDSLHLCSVIGKSSTHFSLTECWYAIKSISGTTILLDKYGTGAGPGTEKGYSGTTETTAAYIKNAAIVPDLIFSGSGTSIYQIGGSFTYGYTENSSDRVTVEGGYDTSDNLVGESFYATRNPLGAFFDVTSPGYIFRNIGVARASYGIRSSNSHYTMIDNCNFIGMQGSGTTVGGYFCNVYNCTYAHCYSAHTIANSNAGNCGGSNLLMVSSEGYGLNLNVAGYCQFTNLTSLNSSYGIYIGNGVDGRFGIKKINDHTSAGVYYNNSSNNTEIYGMDDTAVMNGNVYALRNGGNSATVANLTVKNISFTSTSYDVQITYGNVEFRNCAFNATNEIYPIAASVGFGFFSSYDHDKTVGNHKWYRFGVIATKTANGIEYYNYDVTPYVNRFQKARFPFSPLAVNANSQVTITVTLQKNSATANDIDAQLWLPLSQLVGLSSDVISAKTTDTTSQQTLSISFTPTISGVVVPELMVWGAQTTKKITLSNYTATQA